jgi:hypothetical protein
MQNYAAVTKEETLKARVFADFFGTAKYAYEPNIDNIDFVVADTKTQRHALYPQHFFWAEAKKGVADVRDMLTQLILTCKKTVDRGLHLPPPFIGCFDAQKIAFVPFYDVLPLFVESDVNWNATPSDYDTGDFQKLREKLTRLCLAHIEVFQFETEANEIKAFVKKNLKAGAGGAKIKINKNNFIHIFYKWVKEVKPSINLSDAQWVAYKKQEIFDCDFFRADMMSKEELSLAAEEGAHYNKYSSISDRLEIILRSDKYDIPKLINELNYHTEIDFSDGGEAYRRFWAKYERPPAEEYRDYIVERRFLLVDQNIREIRGEFFTPPEWVELSQDYIARVFGEDWQHEYYVWDCCAGSGNLLVGLQEPERIWVSDISEANVKTMKQLAKDRKTLRDSHIFPFDFLNDSFEKLPADLKKIIDDKDERKKLIIYINPPYTETMSKRGTDKTGLNQTMVNTKYALSMGNCANRELFVQFLTRMYFEIPDCVIAHFSKMKILNAPHFINFREYFRAKLLRLFVVPADTFENVTGKFPIGFYIWNTNIKEKITDATADVYDREHNLIGAKRFQHYDDVKFINDWIISTRNRESEKKIGFLSAKGNDFQNTNYVYIVNVKEQLPVPRGSWITDKNLIEVCVYYSVRHVIPATWLNDRDQFLYPVDGWRKDGEFQANCLVYTLFNNNISCKYGVNHWIPFTEDELGVQGEFKSRFMSGFLRGARFGVLGFGSANSDMFDNADGNVQSDISTSCILSAEAQAVLDAGRALFRYYHEKAQGKRKASLDASFYDIREWFQGRNENGKMNVTSSDEKYTALLAKLRAAQKRLAQKIAPKIYEYGFLRG